MIDLIMANKFPALLCVLDIFAAGEQLHGGNTAKVIYWIAAAMITGSTIFMK